MNDTVMKLKENILLRIKNWRLWAGIGAGAVAGYLYYYYIGCSSGSCPITSNPYISVLYGALAGSFLFDTKKKKES